MNDYRCESCNGYIIVGQHIVLKTTVVSIEYQQLGESLIYHERCYRTNTDDKGSSHE